MEKEDYKKDNKIELKELNNASLINGSSNNNIIAESLFIYNSSSLSKSDEFNNFIDKSFSRFSSSRLENLKYINFIPYKILIFKTIIGSHKISAEFIKEIFGTYFISGGMDKYIFIYDKTYKKIYEGKHKNIIDNVYEMDSSKKDKIIFAISKNEIKLISISPNKYSSIIKSIKINISFFINIKENLCIIGNETGVYSLMDILSQIIQKKEIQILNKSYKSGIIINDYLVALTSNIIIHNGENKLKIYNTQIKNFVYEIEGYSFTTSLNGLTIMENNVNKNNYKILLCACKKYISGQKNGILLINIYIDEEILDTRKYFYNTGDFEVTCFCPIFIVQKSSFILIQKESEIYETNYFFVGGFHKIKGKGIIKLFKLIYNKIFFETRIEYIQDIELSNHNNFKGFKSSISSIIQSQKNGNILVTCWDGNVYLFDSPNLDYFLFYDNLNKS